MDIETARLFLNKKVELRFLNDFVLTGQIIAVDPNGCVFETPQKKSYVAFSKVGSIIILEE